MFIPEWLLILVIVLGSLIVGWLVLIAIMFSFIMVGSPQDAHDIDINDKKR